MTKPPVLGATPRRGRSVRIGDVELYFEEHGSGTPLVLLHGFGGCTRNWAPFIPALSERHRLILVDLPGHGRSTDPAKRFTHREAGRDILRLLDELGIERFSAMGMSSGGMALLHMATRQPDRIDAMVLISATSHLPEQARVIMRSASLARMPSSVQTMYRDCASRGDAQVRQLIAAFNALGDDHDDMNFTEEHLSTIKARTLIVHGDRDRFFPVAIPVSLQRSIPDATLWIVAGGEHVPVLDPAVPFVATALRFLEGA